MAVGLRSRLVTGGMAGWVTAHYLPAIRKLMESSPGGTPADGMGAPEE